MAGLESGMPRYVALLVLLFAVCTCTACTGLLKPEPAQAQAWHSAQWQALAKDWQAGQDSLTLTQQPRPWGVGARHLAAYAAVLDCRAEYSSSWAALDSCAREKLAYVRELLAALYQRDEEKLRQLSTRLDSESSQMQQAMAAYSTARKRRAAAILALKQLWEESWGAEQVELDFDLDAALAAQSPVAEMTPELDAALRAYHAHHYARMQRRYLSWAAGTGQREAQAEDAAAVGTAVPGLVLSAAGDGLRAALQALEAALLARNALETQAALDASVLQRYREQQPTADPLLSQLQPDQRSATRRYREPRVAIAEARLALFSRIDALLRPIEDIFQYEASRQWKILWPDCPLETNIYAFSGLPPRQTEH